MVFVNRTTVWATHSTSTGCREGCASAHLSYTYGYMGGKSKEAPIVRLHREHGSVPDSAY